jgi:hypothetical protein
MTTEIISATGITIAANIPWMPDPDFVWLIALLDFC